MKRPATIAPASYSVSPTVLSRIEKSAFHLAARLALLDFRRRLGQAPAHSRRALHRTLQLNAGSAFGRAHDFAAVLAAADPVAEFQARVPLSTYTDYEPFVERIAAGEPNVLSTEPIHMLAGSSGTTGRPKRIPRTRRAQRHHLQLVVLAEQAVLDRAFPAVRGPARGINLMSSHAAPAPDASRVPVLAGPNAGMARMRRFMPLLWCAPASVYDVADPLAALYLHALFALRYPEARYIQTPFAPQLTGWFALIERYQADLLQDLATGTLAAWLPLTAAERDSVHPALYPAPARAAAVAEIFARGFAGIIPRLWPALRYVWTVTSGSFALSVPRLRWLCGPNLLIHSGCHSSSEGILGIQLAADGSSDYVLAVGSAFFEFIERARADAAAPPTVALEQLTVGREYELVLTSSAGLYRYRLGDVIRITGWTGAAPRFEFLYRRGTVLNLVGEKTSEYHTAQAVGAAVTRWLGGPNALREYTVAGSVRGGVGCYTFYVELAEPIGAERLSALQEVERSLDASLADLNPYYRSSGRQPGRLAGPRVKVVRPGTFDRLLRMQRLVAAPTTASQVKVPRVVTRPEQLALLESQLLAATPLSD